MRVLPEIPRLRALENQAVELPVSVSSAASSASPRSGSSRVHPYHPVGEAIEGSSFEIAPSTATRAASASGHDESVEATPIRRHNSSPVVLEGPQQVMSPNLVARMASGSTQAPGEPDLDPAAARAILQSWSEVQNVIEDGTVARTVTQCAKTWPLADQTAFDNIEAALQVLKQACEYLHQGLTQVNSTVDQKVDTGKAQEAVSEIAGQIWAMKSGMANGANRHQELSTKIDRMIERIASARGRIDAVGAQLDREGAAQLSAIVDLRESNG